MNTWLSWRTGKQYLPLFTNKAKPLDTSVAFYVDLFTSWYVQDVTSWKSRTTFTLHKDITRTCINSLASDHKSLSAFTHHPTPALFLSVCLFHLPLIFPIVMVLCNTSLIWVKNAVCLFCTFVSVKIVSVQVSVCACIVHVCVSQ